ncbi:MAG: hypothetical protein ACKVH7_08575 [Alphaproteobacteria bacterium]|jgi:hypothetical protein
MSRKHLSPIALTFGAALLLAGCSSFDWERSGQLWLGSLCDSSSHCSNDSDGDPYTRL